MAVKLTVVDCNEILDAMEELGGGFVKLFAAAYRKADPHNRQLLQPVYQKYKAEYADKALWLRRKREANGHKTK